MLTNAQILEMLSGAMTLLESDLYDNDNNADAAHTANALANCAAALSMVKAAADKEQERREREELVRRCAELIRRGEAVEAAEAADNDADNDADSDGTDNPDYFETGEDTPPDDYDGEESP